MQGGGEACRAATGWRTVRRAVRRADPITQLRSAIDCLPVDTRRAMLDGVRSNAIVMGAYTDSDGGVCPMLAAHRNGGRTSFLAFARAWDGFGGASTTRRATRREVRILVTQLEASLAAEETTDLQAAIAEYQASKARRSAAEHELAPPLEIEAGRLGPAGAIRRLRPSRRTDAEGALARFEAERDRLERSPA